MCKPSKLLLRGWRRQLLLGALNLILSVPKLDKVNQVYIKTMDTNTSRYWIMCVISVAGYKEKKCTEAKNFFDNEFPQFIDQETLSKRENQYIIVHLWQMFYNHNLDIEQCALAGLCLRCYVSHIIIKGCRIIQNKNSDVPNLFVDLLPDVLNDDGSTFIVMDSDGKTQLELNKNGETQIKPRGGKFFSVEILKTFNPNLPEDKASQSLDNWGIRLINQNKDVQDTLWEMGVWVSSYWSLLCKNIPQDLENDFTDDERYSVEVFHKVYRKDRLESCQRGRYCEPTNDQLERMRRLLQNRRILLDSNDKLTEFLEKIAERLHNYEYYTRIRAPKVNIKESVSQDGDNNADSEVDRLPANESNTAEDIEEAELRDLVNETPFWALRQGIPLKISQRGAYLARRRKYSAYAQKVLEGYQLLYRINNSLSLGDIGKLWGISWATVRRILKPSDLIKKIQEYVVEKSMERFKQKADELNINQEVFNDASKFKEITEKLREYLDKIIFKDAYKELTASRTPYKNSLFAQELRKHINNQRNLAS